MFLYSTLKSRLADPLNMILRRLRKATRSMLYSLGLRKRTMIPYAALLRDGEEGRALRGVLNTTFSLQSKDGHPASPSGDREKKYLELNGVQDRK